MANKDKNLLKSPAIVVAGVVLVAVIGLFTLINSSKNNSKQTETTATVAANSLLTETPRVENVISTANATPGANSPQPTAIPEPTLSLVNPVLTVVSTGLDAIAAEQLKKLQALQAQVVAKPFVLTAPNQNWTVPVERLKKLVKINGAELDLDRGNMDDLFKTWSKSVEKKPVDAKVIWSDKENRVTATKPSAVGQKLAIDTTFANFKAALNKGENKAELAIEPDAPRIDSENLDKLGIKEKISEGISGFAGSDGNRAKNIVLGADYIDNTLVPPKGTFSFNNAVGPITKERGFADGYAIVGDATEKEVGGGICQVSTTTFRAAFWAGFNITERHPHAYRVIWYESLNEVPGMDATIYQPGSDFKFTNDTDSWVMVSTYVNNAKLRVVFYGTKPDWKVAMTPESGKLLNETNPPAPRIEVDPKLAPGEKKKVDSAHKGFDTSIGRIIMAGDGTQIRKDNYASHYVAWPEVYKVGPAAPVKTAAPAAPVTTAATTNGPATTPPGTTAVAPAPSKSAAPATTAAPAPPPAAAATTVAAVPPAANPPAPPPPPTAPPAQSKP